MKFAAAVLVLGSLGLVPAVSPVLAAPVPVAPRAVPYAVPHCPSAQFGATVAISGAIAAIGARSAPHGGAVCVFARAGKNWHLQAVLGDPHPAKWDEYGNQVAVSTTSAGTYLMVGAFNAGNNNGNAQPEGPVYVYRKSASSWRLTQTLNDPIGKRPGDWFGSILAMSGPIAVITALGENNFKGAVYMYTLAGHSWRLQGTLKNPGVHDFGGLAAVSGPTVVIGNGGQSSPPGAPVDRGDDRAGQSVAAYPDAYVFVRTGSKWHLQAHITAHSSDDVEEAVAVSGSRAWLGGFFEPGFGGSDKNADRGHVYVFARANGSWHQTQILADPAKSHGDFSAGLALDGPVGLVGSPFTGCGVAYVYKWSKKWVLRAKLVPPVSKCSTGQGFGWAVAVSGATAIIGSPGNGKTYVLNIP